MTIHDRVIARMMGVDPSDVVDLQRERPATNAPTDAEHAESLRHLTSTNPQSRIEFWWAA